MLTAKGIITLWLGVYVRYTQWNMLDIPQQNPWKCDLSGVEVTITAVDCIINPFIFDMM